MPIYIYQNLHPVHCKYVACMDSGDIDGARQYAQFIVGFLSALLASEEINAVDYGILLYTYTRPIKH